MARVVPLSYSLLLIVALTTQAVSAGDQTESPAARLTVDRLYSLPTLIGTAPKGYAWSRDSRRLAFLWNDEGSNFHDIWIVDLEDTEPAPKRVTRLPRLQEEEGAARDPVSRARAAEQLERDPGVARVTWYPDSEGLLFSFRGDLWSLASLVPGAEPRPITDTPAVETGATFSPDGQTLAFLRGGDLWSLQADATDSGTEAQRLTQSPTPEVAVTAFEWSPDSSRILLTESDHSGVVERGIPDYLSAETELDLVRRAYPGEEPVRQRLGLVRGTGGDIEWIELSALAPDMVLASRWSPDGKWLAVDTSDLYAKGRRIFVVELEGGPAARILATDQDPFNESFYFWRIAWSTDSQWLYFLSDRQGDYHVYGVSPLGDGETRRLTRGPWAVAEMHPVDDGLILVGNRRRAEQRHLFRVNSAGDGVKRLSQRAGTHSPIVSPDGRHAAVSFSSDTSPPELLLTALGDDRDERPIAGGPIAEFADYRWVKPRYVTFQSHIDGTTLHGRMTLPPDFDPSRKYPAILGSVYTDSVRNQWGGRTAHPTWGLDQFLAQEGYVLLNVDMRGSWGRGREHRRGIRLDYGGMDIEDLESGVRFLVGQGHVDAERVGIWGSSYGGLMTAMSLFRKPRLYAAGVAGAPATNVRHALTGQMAVMMHPDDQALEYDDSSPYLHAHGLNDPLMIIHGMRDRVVLFKDSVTLVDRLILLGKDVELVALPDAGHGWDNEGLAQTRYAFKKLVGHFDRHLKRTTEDQAAPEQRD